MPGLTISTKDLAGRQPGASSAARSSSPTRPDMSPITPTFASAQAVPTSQQQQRQPPFAQGRQTYTHSQPDQTGMPPPPAAPEPISFDDNPDVLALKSAISILQMQRARATRDVQSLSRAKEAALADTEGFIADLGSGKVGTEADRLFPDLTPRRQTAEPAEEEEDSDDTSDEDEDEDMAESTEDQATPTDSANSLGSASTTPQKDTDKPAPSPNQKEKKKKKQPSAPAPAWRTLPKPQNVVRCPPINWSQYGVVGESLDKLHAEQQRAPNQGVPAALKPGGGGLTYEFKGGAGSSGRQETLVGVAAPYAPGKDKIGKKPGRGGKR